MAIYWKLEWGNTLNSAGRFRQNQEYLVRNQVGCSGERIAREKEVRLSVCLFLLLLLLLFFVFCYDFVYFFNVCEMWVVEVNEKDRMWVKCQFLDHR